MTGPEHYREAERYLDRAARATAWRSAWQRREAVWCQQQAQVHATLAQVGITYSAAGGENVSTPEAWFEAVQA